MSGAGERVWDGRGDRLSDARLFMGCGRAADDLRLTGLHLRLLIHLGRQNNRRGWVRISQTELAERWGVSRSRISVAVNELVNWRYVRKRSQAESRESFCLYKIILDDDGEEGSVPDAEHSPQTGECSQGGTPPKARGVPDTEHGCSADGTGVFRSIGHTTEEAEEAASPPKPPEGGGGGIFSVDWIEELRAEGCAPVVLDHFLLPLLAAGLKPWKDADPRSVGRQLCEDFKRRSPAVLREAADRLLDTHRHRLPPVAVARTAVKAAGDRAALVAMRERSAGPSEPEMQRFDRGTPEYERELARWRREDPAWAARIESQGFVRLRVREVAA